MSVSITISQTYIPKSTYTIARCLFAVFPAAQHPPYEQGSTATPIPRLSGLSNGGYVARVPCDMMTYLAMGARDQMTDFARKARDRLPARFPSIYSVRVRT